MISFIHILLVTYIFIVFYKKYIYKKLPIYIAESSIIKMLINSLLLILFSLKLTSLFELKLELLILTLNLILALLSYKNEKSISILETITITFTFCTVILLPGENIVIHPAISIRIWMFASLYIFGLLAYYFITEKTIEITVFFGPIISTLICVFLFHEILDISLTFILLIFSFSVLGIGVNKYLKRLNKR